MGSTWFVVIAGIVIVAFGVTRAFVNIMAKKKLEEVGQIVVGVLFAAIGFSHIVVSQSQGPQGNYVTGVFFMALGVISVESGRFGLRISKVEREIEGLRAQDPKRV